MQTDGTFDMLPKKEVMKHLGEIEKLEKYLGGVKEMKKLPGALFIVDPRKERNAINEARSSGGGSGGGGIQSAQIDAILVMTKSEYDALDKKDARTLYLLEG